MTDSWCILRTSGARTLELADYLNDVGFEAWTPRQSSRRTLRAGRKDQRKVDVDAPFLPTFVFASASRLPALAALVVDDRFPRPPFSIFHYRDRVPLVSARDVQGLRDAEAASADELRRVHQAETREEADRIRIAAIKSEQARRKAQRQAEAERRRVLRAERHDFDKGERVLLEEPAFMGMTGVVQSSDGRTALVLFGDTLSMKIEGWRLIRDAIQAA